MSAPIGFTVVHTVLMPELLACDACGALLRRRDRERYEGWHEGLARVASQAHRADAWTRPLGGGR